MKYWAILHIPSGEYLKTPPGGGKGFTHWNPDDKYAAPRLFLTQGGAKRALNAWLKGTWMGCKTEHIKKEKNRKAENMLVVQVMLITVRPEG